MLAPVIGTLVRLWRAEKAGAAAGAATASIIIPVPSINATTLTNAASNNTVSTSSRVVSVDGAPAGPCVSGASIAPRPVLVEAMIRHWTPRAGMQLAWLGGLDWQAEARLLLGVQQAQQQGQQHDLADIPAGACQHSSGH